MMLRVLLALLFTAPLAAQQVIPDTLRGHPGDTLMVRVILPPIGTYQLRFVRPNGTILARAYVFDTAVPVVVTDPGAVTLRITGASTIGLTVAWTAPSDGTGKAAHVALRWAAGTLTWGDVPTELTVLGTTVGATQSVLIAGLAAGTTYQVQAISYRGTLNVDAVFGPLSNVVTGTTGSVVILPPPPPPPPPPPISGAWPNEPAGLTVRNDYGWSDNPNVNGPIGTSGWASTGGDASRVDDLTAPLSPPSVLQIRYPVGFGGGNGPINCWFDIPGPNVRELFIGFWVKVSNPWQGHPSGVNKLGFVTSGGTQHYALMPVMKGSGAIYTLQQQIAETTVPENPAYGGWLTQNVATPPFTLGVWHRVEMYLKYGTSPTSYNGIMQQWLDGVLVMNYSDINYADDGVDGWKINPTWGGVGSAKSETDYMWFDHVHTSTR